MGWLPTGGGGVSIEPGVVAVEVAAPVEAPPPEGWVEVVAVGVVVVGVVVVGVVIVVVGVVVVGVVVVVVVVGVVPVAAPSTTISYLV
jgi:hypothetical protein